MKFNSIRKHFPGSAVALHNISLLIPAGQICVLLGPSGAGKSTLLRCINGLVTPDEGAVLLDGVELTPRTRKKLRQRIGSVHQNYALSPRLDAFTNVLSGALPAISTSAAMLGLFPERLRLKAVSLVEAVGLSEEHLRRQAGSLSGGQQQRVGIARALINDPEIILADEPVASLDPRTSLDIVQLLADQARLRSATLVCALHQVDLARQMADRIVALKDGEVVFDGPPRDLKPDVISFIYARRTSPAPKDAA